MSGPLLCVFSSRTKKGSQHHYSTEFIEEPGSHYGVSFLVALSSLPLHRGGSDLGSAYLRMTDNRNRLFIPAASHKKGNSVT